MLKKLFSHTAIYGLAPQVTKLAQLMVLPIITPYLTAVDYGIFGLITAVIGAVSVFSTLGLNIVLANSFTKSPNHFKWLWRQVYGFLSIWNIVYAGIVALVVFLFIPENARENTLLILLLNVMPHVLFGPAAVIGSLYYQLKQRPVHIAIRSIVIGVLTLILNIYFIKNLQMGYMGWFWAGAISQFFYQFSYYIPLNFYLNLRPIFNFKIRTIKRQLLICLPTIPHYYSSYLLNSFDRIIMKWYGVDIVNIGKYNAAQIPGNLFISITNAANQAIGPLLLQSYKTNDKLTELKLNFASIITVLTATSLVSLFLKELLPLVIKSEGLENIYSVAVIIVMAYNYRPMYVAANNRLFFVEKTKALLKVTTIASAISVVLNLISIYFFGYFGAAVTLFISFMYMGYSGFFIREFRESNGTQHYPVFWLLLTLILTVLVYFFADLGLFMKLIFGFVLIICSLLGLWRVTKI